MWRAAVAGTRRHPVNMMLQINDTQEYKRSANEDVPVCGMELGRWITPFRYIHGWSVWVERVGGACGGGCTHQMIW